MKVIIASDHAGYRQKERLKKYLERRKIESHLFRKYQRKNRHTEEQDKGVA